MLEAVAVLVRRWVMTRSALGLETDLRRDLYEHLQRLPVAFHDRWQTGQLLSRATGDLSTIRRFVGFGLVFLIVNAVTCVVVGVMLAFSSWPLALLRARLRRPAGGRARCASSGCTRRRRGGRRTSTAS